MSAAATEYRLDGIYRQRQEGFFMQRVKLAAGVLSATQARIIAQAAQQFGQGALHLTSRGSVEIHWLKEADLAALKKTLAAAGLTSRGACGGAVRGVTCASQGAVGFPAVERMAHRIHRHFTGNPRFERLPKKFKIGVEADGAGRRHLIQDVGLLLSTTVGSDVCFDVYVAGGLGREPQPGLLFEGSVSEQRIIPLIEAIARVYAAHAPAGKRLKHLVNSLGEEEFRRFVALETGADEELPPVNGLSENLLAEDGAAIRRLVAVIPSGELRSEQLVKAAECAERLNNGFFMVTADQDLAFHLEKEESVETAVHELEQAGFSVGGLNLRVCPGTSSCLVALSATRDIAAQLDARISEQGRELSWAISGCPNSCTQPQLADVGIVTASLAKDELGDRTPRFDLYRSGAEPFGKVIAQGLTLEQLLGQVSAVQ